MPTRLLDIKLNGNAFCLNTVVYENKMYQKCFCCSFAFNIMYKMNIYNGIQHSLIINTYLCLKCSYFTFITENYKIKKESYQ